jgi:SsrA-binding protein
VTKITKQRLEIRNRKAHHNFVILEKIEAGISLLGSEIKSIRQGKISLGEGWVVLTPSLEAILEGVHINPYEQASFMNHEPLRRRKLLLHKKELIKLSNRLQSGGMTLVPLRVYETRSLIKVEIGLVRGKKNFDKRDSDKQSSAKKEIAVAVKRHNQK